MDIVNIKRIPPGESAPRREATPPMRRRPDTKIIFAVIILGAAGLVVLMFGNYISASKPMVGRYQAIFIANSQVYFGKLSFPPGDYAILREVYYVQAGALETNAENQLDVRLVKLGSEFHEPDDAMFVQKRHIVFYENLTENSRVTKAIIQYNSGDKSQAGGFISK